MVEELVAKKLCARVKGEELRMAQVGGWLQGALCESSQAVKAVDQADRRWQAELLERAFVAR